MRLMHNIKCLEVFLTFGVRGYARGGVVGGDIFVIFFLVRNRDTYIHNT